MKYFFMAVFLVFSRWVLDEPSAVIDVSEVTESAPPALSMKHLA